MSKQPPELLNEAVKALLALGFKNVRLSVDADTATRPPSPVEEWETTVIVTRRLTLTADFPPY
jgi:hypothetical protein